MNLKLYVEGGGDHNKTLQTQCRRGFSEFIRKAGFAGRMPRIVARGGRNRAYDKFQTAHDDAHDGFPILLVDSEGPITATSRWAHVRDRDAWGQPPGASGDQIHFMVMAMEAWFHADKDALQQYYGEAFRRNALNQQNDIERISKNELFESLQRATHNCSNGEYSKGDDSFRILAQIDPFKVQQSSQSAKIFLSTLDQLSNQP